MQPLPAPVVIRPEQLPLGDPNFDWKKFESFCRDFICKYTRVDKCHHYGKPGDIQNGIDTFVDRPNGERWAFRVRQVKKFTKRTAEQAISTVTYKADSYHFLLSCDASQDIRDVCDVHANWVAWDVRDISARVRGLD